jgi:hypothetical protein
MFSGLNGPSQKVDRRNRDSRKSAENRGMGFKPVAALTGRDHAI